MVVELVRKECTTRDGYERDKIMYSSSNNTSIGARVTSRSAGLNAELQAGANPKRFSGLRVLLVVDYVQWILGTIAIDYARFNPWMKATVISETAFARAVERNERLLTNYDLVHFLCPYASRRWAPRLWDKMPVVTSHHHTTDPIATDHNLNGDVILCFSEEWRTYLLVRGLEADRIHCIPYGVDSSCFVPCTPAERAAVRSILGFTPEDVVIGFFGKQGSNESGRKGTEMFIEAAAQLRQAISTASALVIGSGWVDFVEKLRANNLKCIALPFVEGRERFARMYHALDFYWVTSRVEGGPVPLLEAMSSAVCCITTPVGLAPQIVRDGWNGHIVPIDGARRMAEHTVRLAVDCKKRAQIGKEARSTILREMDVAVTAKKIGGVYENALRRYAARTGANSDELVRWIQAPGLARDPDRVFPGTPPLHGIPSNLQKRVRIDEALNWCSHLPHMYLAAARIWARNPTSIVPLRWIFGRLLPSYMIRFLKRLRKANVKVPSA
jgi:glycosyltransferase involved in cell wall biosynthesis